ncbi:HTH_Tnp_Tc3_2 domain-containing protein [Trichonephila clavipes]|nr:HTH_Tnp_Tc3_2 domain-containing protein [Trichonephila clavipes]
MGKSENCLSFVSKRCGPLEDAGKNGWIMADISVMIIAVNLGTIHRRLIQQNLLSYRPLHHLLLTPSLCRARFQWCLDLSGWNRADWGRIVSSDEPRFQLCRDDHRKRVWRRPGHLKETCSVKDLPSSGRASVSEAAVQHVRQSFQWSVTKSMCQASREIQISQTSLLRLLYKMLQLHAYKAQDMLKNT